MRLYFNSFVLSIFFSLSLTAGEDVLRISITNHHVQHIQLSEDISTKGLSFSNASYDDAFGLMPVYIHRIALSSDEFELHAELTEEYSSILLLERAEEIADLDMLGDQFKLTTQRVYLDGAPYVEIILLPYRNLKPSQIEALDSCVISYTLSHAGQEQRASTIEFVENSVLATGDWYRLAVSETGIYSLTYSDLQEMGIAVSGINPKKIRIFGNGNGIVPEKNSDERFDDLLQTPCIVMGEEDGSFDEGDQVIFYGQSSIQWNFVPFEGYGIFQHEVNPYDDQTYYYLNISDQNGLRVSEVQNNSLTPNIFVTQFTDYAVHENEAVNILKTGRQWYGEIFNENRVHEYSFTFPNVRKDYPVSLSTSVAAHSTIQSHFSYYYGDQFLLEAPVSKIIIGTTVYAWTITPDTVGFLPEADNISIRVEYDRPTSTSQGWMDYVALNARRDLSFHGTVMPFRDHLSVANDNVAEFIVSNASQSLKVWDVTDPADIKAMSGTLSGNKFNFRATADKIREYIAFDGSGYMTPVFVERVENQNLHASDPVEYVILTHPDFMQQAERMLALHQGISGLTGMIVTPQQVYNEFSSGKQDPAAIRDFMRMMYEKGDESNRVKYLLLLGDASYDYKDRVPNNTNFVPTYQSVEGLKLGYSFVTDDFFALFDPVEGVNAYGKTLEIGIGRLPVHTVEQGDQMVDKIEAYLTMQPQVLDDWRNEVYFIADDEDQNLHYNQAEKLQEMLDTGYHAYNRQKIYLDAFPQVSSPSGDQYPEVNKNIDLMMDKGALIVNYTGHGGEGGWAHEKVLDIPTINKWDNIDRLPLFITATCEFSRFDDPSMISAGEWVFLNPAGGGIGLLTTSRLAWADPNFRLNKAVYEFMFKRTAGEYYRLGDIVRLAKTDQNNGTNIKNFVLLGDPAMQLAYPMHLVKTLIINGNDATSYRNDTLFPMSEVTIDGMVTDYKGDTLEDFNGVLYFKFLDKDLTMSTLGNDAGSYPSNFDVHGANLYEGKATIDNGFFTISFFLPENMSSNVDLAKISYYAYDTINMRDAHGYYRMRAGGENSNPVVDIDGPAIDMYLNNTKFVSGDYTDADPVFLAYLFDEHGINHTGNGIGKDITLTLDGDPDHTFNLNDYFDPDMDSYHGGWISFPLTGIKDGHHVLTLKAWDNMNNVTEKSIQFEVNVDGELALTDVMNYPNPFTESTYFTFDHNKPGNGFEIEIRIFNVNGQHVRTLYHYSASEGLSIDPIRWDGRNEYGNRISNGLYVYRVYVTDKLGNQFVQTSKLIYNGSD